MSEETESKEDTKPNSKATVKKKTAAKKKQIRDANNLINALDYEFDSLGRIEWKKLIPKEHISPNITKCESRGKDPFKLSKEEVENLPEDEQLILLQGFKDLAHIRGYSKLEEQVQFFDNRAVSTVKITWLGNPDSNNESIEVTTCGEAHYHNTFSFGQNYLARMAANRAFIANVKEVCRIQIYGKDELGGDSSGNPKTNDLDNPGTFLLWEMVEKKYDEMGLKWDQVGPKIHEGYPETKGCSSFKELSRFENVLKAVLRSLKEHEKKKAKESE